MTQTKVIHSHSKAAWNVVGTAPGGKYKIARVPYVVCGAEDIDCKNRQEALNHATFISQCFNKLYTEKETEE